jgi:hypothetical protein
MWHFPRILLHTGEFCFQTLLGDVSESKLYKPDLRGINAAYRRAAYRRIGISPTTASSSAPLKSHYLATIQATTICRGGMSRYALFGNYRQGVTSVTT